MAGGQLAVVVQQIHRVAATAARPEHTDGQLLERFLAGEEAAFAALVRRHGPMVLGVCRRTLRDRHAAEDAFQATFLVLLRRARSLDRRGSVAGWLYTVACHIALRARADAARRQRQERLVLLPPDAGRAEPTTWTDLQPVLDEELRRLPEAYRAAVVLCYLEGKTNAEAAAQLGWPVGTVKGRLARARTLLRDRLTRRGVTLTGGLLCAALADHATAAVAARLVETTLRTALPGAVGVPASSAAVILAEGALRTMFGAKLKTMAGLLILAGLVAFGVAASTHAAPAQTQVQIQLKGKPGAGGAMMKGPKGKPPLGAMPGRGTGKTEDMRLAGRVLGPDAKGVAGADVTVLAWRPAQAVEKPRILGQARTDREGKYTLTVRRPPPEQYEAVAFASAPGRGLGWHWLWPGARADIRLEPEGTVRGRLIDLQGQPAANVRLEVTRLGARQRPGHGGYMLVTSRFSEEDPEDDTVHTWSSRPHGSVTKDGTLFYALDAAVKEGKTLTPPRLVLPTLPPDLPGWPTAVTTDADGRFVLRGIPRGREVGLRVRDPRFALQTVHLPSPKQGKATEATCVLSPARRLEGTVTDLASGKPVPHARVKVYAPGSTARFRLDFGLDGRMAGVDLRGRRGFGNTEVYAAFAPVTEFGLPDDGDPDLPALETQADAEGRFRLALFTAGSYTLRATPPRGEPYLPRTAAFRWPQGAVVRKVVDISLPRGVKVRGRVTEAPGGKAVAEARVDFWSKGLQLPKGVRPPPSVTTGPDGIFEALLPPAVWHLLVNGPEPVYAYRPIPIREVLVEVPPPGYFELPNPGGKKPPGSAKPQPPRNFYPDAWLTLDVKAGDRPRETAVTLQRALLLRGRVVGADGKPAAGVLLVRRPALAFEEVAFLNQFTRRALLDITGMDVAHYAEKMRLQDWLCPREPLELRDGMFSIPVLDPKASYPLYFLDAKHNQGAFVELSGKQGGKEPVTIRLAPGGAVRARLLDAKGKGIADYRPDVELLLQQSPKGLPEWDTDRLGWAESLRQLPQKGPATDTQGCVTLPGLIPGATYRLRLGGGKARDFRVRPGEALDLGELTVTVAQPGRPQGARPARVTDADFFPGQKK